MPKLSGLRGSRLYLRILICPMSICKALRRESSTPNKWLKAREFSEVERVVHSLPANSGTAGDMMCEWGNTVPLAVPIPAGLSHTGEARWAVKPVDSCIAPIVRALNDAGIYTAACCCGHGERDGEIVLQDGRTLVVRSPEQAR
jgi:hypothetical protein